MAQSSLDEWTSNAEAALKVSNTFTTLKSDLLELRQNFNNSDAFKQSISSEISSLYQFLKIETNLKPALRVQFENESSQPKPKPKPKPERPLSSPELNKVRSWTKTSMAQATGMPLQVIQIPKDLMTAAETLARQLRHSGPLKEGTFVGFLKTDECFRKWTGGDSVQTTNKSGSNDSTKQESKGSPPPEEKTDHSISTLFSSLGITESLTSRLGGPSKGRISSAAKRTFKTRVRNNLKDFRDTLSQFSAFNSADGKGGGSEDLPTVLSFAVIMNSTNTLFLLLQRSWEYDCTSFSPQGLWRIPLFQSDQFRSFWINDLCYKTDVANPNHKVPEKYLSFRLQDENGVSWLNSKDEDLPSNLSDKIPQQYWDEFAKANSSIEWLQEMINVD